MFPWILYECLRTNGQFQTKSGVLYTTVSGFGQHWTWWKQTQICTVPSPLENIFRKIFFKVRLEEIIPQLQHSIYRYENKISIEIVIFLAKPAIKTFFPQNPPRALPTIQDEVVQKGKCVAFKFSARIDFFKNHSIENADLNNNVDRNVSNSTLVFHLKIE